MEGVNKRNVKISLFIAAIGFIIVLSVLIIFNRSNIQTDRILEETNINNNNWVRIDGIDRSEINIQRSKYLFKVLDVTHYIKQIENYNVFTLKSVVTGNIDGLQGKHTIELNYMYGSLISKDMEFNVYVYKTVTIEGDTVILEINTN